MPRQCTKASAHRLLFTANIDDQRRASVTFGLDPSAILPFASMKDRRKSTRSSLLDTTEARTSALVPGNTGMRREPLKWEGPFDHLGGTAGTCYLGGETEFVWAPTAEVRHCMNVLTYVTNLAAE